MSSPVPMAIGNREASNESATKLDTEASH